MRSVQFPVLGVSTKKLQSVFCFQCEKPLYALVWFSKRSIKLLYFIFNLKYSQEIPERCFEWIFDWVSNVFFHLSVGTNTLVTLIVHSANVNVHRYRQITSEMLIDIIFHCIFRSRKEYQGSVHFKTIIMVQCARYNVRGTIIWTSNMLVIHCSVGLYKKTEDLDNIRWIGKWCEVKWYEWNALSYIHSTIIFIFMKRWESWSI